MDLKKGDESGQALFELMIFLPFLIYFFSIIINIGNSINASINQQKATRGYFHHRMSGNPNLPSRESLSSLANIKTVGMEFVGWQEDSDEEMPLAPCFKLGSFFGSKVDEKCRSQKKAGKNESNFVRIYTAYGVCGASFRYQNGRFVHDEYSRGAGSCARRQ